MISKPPLPLHNQEPSGYAPTSGSTLLELTSRWAAALRAALWLVASLSCAAVAAAGCALLCYLLLTRAFTPEASAVARELHLDFLSSAMTADTLFLPARAALDDGMGLQPPADSRWGLGPGCAVAGTTGPARAPPAPARPCSRPPLSSSSRPSPRLPSRAIASQVPAAGGGGGRLAGPAPARLARPRGHGAGRGRAAVC